VEFNDYFGEFIDIKFPGDKTTTLVEFSEEYDAIAALDNIHLSEHFGHTIFASYATKGNLSGKRKAIWDTSIGSKLITSSLLFQSSQFRRFNPLSKIWEEIRILHRLQDLIRHNGDCFGPIC
jgi:hypothetical protein